MTNEIAPPSEFGPKSHLKRNLATLFVCMAVIISAAVILLKPGGLLGEGVYSKPEWGFEVQVPSGWGMEECTQPIVLRLKTQDNIFVDIGLYPKVSLEQLVADTKSVWEPYFNVVSERSREVTGISAWEIIFMEKMGQSKRKEILLNGEKYSYAIMCFAPTSEKYDEFDPVFEEVVNSFKLI